ncbi:MAG: hypothetical protein K0S68_58 [Candidatus Saccharibacteria bacterium]|jgi:hypothetical protein|nr:hypothetical protein [Candidatus Saccharibacteria bacterium]
MHTAIRRLLTILAAAAVAFVLQSGVASADDKWDDHRRLYPPSGTVVVQENPVWEGELDVFHTPSDCPNGPEVYYQNPNVTADPHDEYGQTVVIEEQPQPDTVIVIEEPAPEETVIVEYY